MRKYLYTADVRALYRIQQLFGSVSQHTMEPRIVHHFQDLPNKELSGQWSFTQTVIITIAKTNFPLPSLQIPFLFHFFFLQTVWPISSVA